MKKLLFAVGQPIGLKDKNAVEIKNGDRLKEVWDNDGKKEITFYTVIYNPECASFMLETKERGKKYYEYFEDAFCQNDFEIIN